MFVFRNSLDALHHNCNLSFLHNLESPNTNPTRDTIAIFTLDQFQQQPAAQEFNQQPTDAIKNTFLSATREVAMIMTMCSIQ